jgi:tRNA(Glu) U13 pseudouridine synthase TruD
VAFDLPAGAFATVVLQELLGPGCREGSADDQSKAIDAS